MMETLSEDYSGLSQTTSSNGIIIIQPMMTMMMTSAPSIDRDSEADEDSLVSNSTPFFITTFKDNHVAPFLLTSADVSTGSDVSVPSNDSRTLPSLNSTEVWTPEVVQRVSTLALLMLITLIGNVAVIVTLTCGSNRKWLHSRVNLFIVNLAVGDLTVCFFTMTTEVMFVTFETGWVLGALACKVLLYVQIVTLASITFILTAMSFDRYLAICRPIGTLAMDNDKRRRLMLIVCWTMAFILAIPQLVIFKQVAVGVYPDGTVKYECKSKGYTAWWQRKAYFTFLTAYILVVPAILMTFCYVNIVRVVFDRSRDVSTGPDPGRIPTRCKYALRKSLRDPRTLPRTKIRTVQMTLSIISTFVACWTPYFVVHLVHIWTEYKHHIPEAVYVFSENLALVNSAVNPVLYAWFNVRLKQRLYSVLCPRRGQRRLRTHQLNSEASEAPSTNIATSDQQFRMKESLNDFYGRRQGWSCSDAGQRTGVNRGDNWADNRRITFPTREDFR